MSLRDLLVLYALVGVACAIAALRREPRRAKRRFTLAAVGSALATIPLWPLWAPFVLASARPGAEETRTPSRWPAPRTRGAPAAPAPSDAPLARIQRALDEAVSAVAGTPMSQLFSRQVADRIAEEVGRVAERHAELTLLTQREGLDHKAASDRLRALEAQGGDASARTVATARLQAETLAQLEALRETDGRAIEELADLLQALRAQLLLARYAGSSADGTGAIVTEVWARLEGLGAGLEPSMATPT